MQIIETLNDLLKLYWWLCCFPIVLPYTAVFIRKRLRQSTSVPPDHLPSIIKFLSPIAICLLVGAALGGILDIFQAEWMNILFWIGPSLVIGIILGFLFMSK